MACGVSMERYDPGEQDWIVFNNFWPKEVSEKVKKGSKCKNFQNMACGVSMERYDRGEQEKLVFNNF